MENCLLLSGLFPTAQDLRHVHTADLELLPPLQMCVIRAKSQKYRVEQKSLDIGNKVIIIRAKSVYGAWNKKRFSHCYSFIAFHYVLIQFQNAELNYSVLT